ncbi:hypothetical protein [Paramesorhizobium deserti]|uniref:hypothetical protein n=1 Tax=Paramesorhizobium deserti TaxID=1494590 RepID=UPI00137AA398|nr:hypothetical protein [Paramesorhizobium deserti]
MKLSMALTMDGLIRSLRWRGVEQVQEKCEAVFRPDLRKNKELREGLMEPRTDARKEDETDDERQYGTAEGGLSRPFR